VSTTAKAKLMLSFPLISILYEITTSATLVRCHCLFLEGHYMYSRVTGALMRGR